MMYKKITNLFLIMLASLAIIALLMIFSDRPHSHKGKFYRKLSSQPVTLQYENSTLYITDIAGSTLHTIFFAGTVRGQIIATDYTLRPVDTFQLKATTASILPAFSQIRIDSPQVVFYAQNNKLIWQGILNRYLTNIRIDTTCTFSHAIRLPDGSFLFKSMTGNLQPVFKKARLEGQMVEQNILFDPAKMDALISGDGMLTLDPSIPYVIYMHYYNNTFLSMDTGLLNISSCHTIDSFQSQPIKTKLIVRNHKGSLMNASPLYKINRTCCVYRGSLYVVSNHQADNETDSLFADSSPVDVYAVPSGEYQSSFYIPNVAGEKVRKIYVAGNMLVAGYPHAVATYVIGGKYPYKH